MAPGVAAGQRHEGGVLVRYAYDTEGNLSGDSQPNLAAATDALGGSWRYRYQNHLMVAYTTKTGFTHHQEWSRLDAGGRVIRTWCDEPGVLDTRFTYDVAHRVTHVTDALGRVSSYHYNPHHEVIAIEEPGPADASGAPTRILTRTEMDASGNPTEAVDALGRTTRYQWDERGNLLAVTDAAGATTRFAYNALNLPVEITDAEGGHWRNTYDERGNLLAHTDALGHTTGYQVDARGLPLVITDALGKPKQLQWDGAGQLVAYTDCSGQTTRYGYDALFNPLWLVKLEELISRHPQARSWSVYRSAYEAVHWVHATCPKTGDILVNSICGHGMTFDRAEWERWGIKWDERTRWDSNYGNTLDMHHAANLKGHRWVTPVSYVEHTGVCGVNCRPEIPEHAQFFQGTEEPNA